MWGANDDTGLSVVTKLVFAKRVINGDARVVIISALQRKRNPLLRSIDFCVGGVYSLPGCSMAM